MVFFCGVGLLRLLLTITAAVPISNSATTRDKTKGAPWIQYVDATYAVCIISHKEVQISMKLTTLLRCFNAQWKHLQCISSSQPLENFLAATGTTSALLAPCGLIHLSNTIEASSSTGQWRITVHRQLYLNLTFQELVLSMPYGRCDLLVKDPNTSQSISYLIPCLLVYKEFCLSLWRAFTIFNGIEKQSYPATVQTSTIRYTDGTFPYSVPSLRPEG